MDTQKKSSTILTKYIKLLEEKKKTKENKLKSLAKKLRIKTKKYHNIPKIIPSVKTSDSILSNYISSLEEENKFNDIQIKKFLNKINNANKIRAQKKKKKQIKKDIINIPDYYSFNIVNNTGTVNRFVNYERNLEAQDIQGRFINIYYHRIYSKENIDQILRNLVGNRTRAFKFNLIFGMVHGRIPYCR